MFDPLNPNASLLCKLGSILVHFDEYSSPDGRTIDRIEAERLMKDPEVVGWLTGMSRLAMVPVKRMK